MKINYKRLLIVSGVILLILGVIYFNRYNPVFRGLMALEPAETILEFEPGMAYRFSAYHDDIIMQSRESIKCLSKNGETKWTIPIKATNPFVFIKGRYIMIADRGGKEIKLYKDNTEIQTITTEHTIITAKINENGFIIAATEESGFRGMISVYNPVGSVLYKWHSGEGYIIDADIDRNNSVIAISTLLAESQETANSCVNFFNIKETDPFPFSSVVRADSIINTVMFNRDGSLTALSESELIRMGGDGKLQWEYPFNGYGLTSYDITSENTLSIILKNSQNNSEVHILGRDGKKRGVYTANGEVKNISVSGEVILVSQLRDIFILSPKGDVNATTAVKQDIRKLEIFDNRHEALVIGGSEASIAAIR